MPLATGTAPSGENFEFYVPKGTPDEQGPMLAKDAYYRLRQGIDVTQPPPPPDSTFTGELMRGGESLISALRTAGGAAFGDDEAAALAGLERSEDIAQRYGQGPSLQNVLDAEGILPTVGTALGQIPQAVAGQGAQLLSTAALAKLGAVAGAPFGPVGSLAGAGIGGLASLIPQFTGYNIERQAQADIDEGRPVDIELGKAVGTAALQSVPELAGQYFVLGKGLVNKLVQGDVTKLSATELRDSAAKLIRDANLSTAKTVGRGIARGAGVEMPTEIAQQVLERAQAGLDVLSSEAISEYGEAAYLAATVGGTLGPIGALGSRSRARSLRDELSGREAEVAEATTEETLALPAPEERLGLPPPEGPLEGEILSPEPPPALPQGMYRLPPPPTGDGSAVLVDSQGRAYPERFAAEFEEAIANEEKLRSEGAQRELFTQLMAGEKTAITKEDLESLGITSVKLKKELPALNLADPQDARTAVETIVNYANNPTVKSRYSDSRNKVLGLLNMPILTRAETLAARENAQQEATEMTSEMDQISRGDAPGQVTIDEGIEQNVIDEQREAAFAGREQELADDTEALAATLNAAKSPDGIPTAMESAFDAAQKPTTRRRSANTQEKTANESATKAKDDTPDSRNATAENLDQQRVDKELDEEKFRAEFTEVESGNDMESFLGTLAQQSIDGTPQQKIEANAKVAWIRQNASESINTDLEAAQNDVRSNLGLRLPAKKLVGGAAVLDPEVTQLLRDGKLVEALEALSNNKNKEVKRVARLISKAIAEGNTKVTFQADLIDSKGRILAGMYDPRTNTVIINENIPPTIHALLHESLHAVTSHEIANKSSATTKQLQKLFDSVKDRLDDSYGTTSLDEFVAEAFSNPEFQAKLASLDTNGDKLGVWERFKNIIANIVRKLRGLPMKQVTSARSEVDKLVTDLISPAPEYRDGPALNLAVTAKEEGKFLDKVLGGYGGDVTQEAVATFNDYMPGATNFSRQFFLNILPLNSIADFAKQSNNEVIQELGRELDGLFKIIQQRNGSRQKYLLRTKDMAKRFDRILARAGEDQRELFNTVVMESTLRRVDPDKGREYYTKYRYNYVDQNGQEQRSRPMSEAQRDAQVAALEAKNEKLPQDQQLKIEKINPSEGTIEQFNVVDKEWQKLKPEVKQVYRDLREEYSRAYTELRKVLVARIDSVPTDNAELQAAKQSYKDKILLELLNKENIEPYFPLFRKGDFWYNHREINPLTGEYEYTKHAFESRQARSKYIRAVQEDTQLRETLLNSEIQTIVANRDKAREDLLNATPNATPEQIQQAEFLGALEGAEATRPQNEQQARSSVDIQWANGLLGDVRRKKDVAADKARDKVLAKAKEENREPTPEELREAKEIRQKVLTAGNAVDTIVLDALLNAMPERSLYRAFQRRKNIRGAQQDAVDVFKQRMPAFMGQVDNLRFDAPLTNVVNNLDTIASQAAGTEDAEYARQFAAKGADYVKFVKNPQIASWSRRLKSAGFLMTLGFNVSSAVVNSFILPIVVYPYLAGQYGWGNTKTAMMDAKRLYFSTGMKRKMQGLENLPEEFEFDGPSLANLDLENLPEEYKEFKPLIEELIDRGAANASTIGDMLDLDNPTGGEFDKVLTAVNGISGFLFHQGERFNRQVTAMAGYKLALDKAKAEAAKNGTEVTEEKKQEIVNQVLLDVEHTNSGALIETAPKLAQSNIGSVLLMYKRFGVSMAYLQMKMAKQALRMGNFTEEERGHAKAQLVGLFGMSGLLAGAQGLPLYGVVSGVANLFFLDDQDDDFDSIVAANIGEGAYSGILNEIFGLDVAPRIGMTNLMFRSLPNNEVDDFLQYAMEMGGGPLYGIAQRGSRSLNLMQEGNFARGLEGMIPAGFSGPLRSIRYATDGATTLRGDPITENLSPVSILGQFFGFAPASYTKQLELNARDKRIDRNISEKRTKLLRQRYMAFREGDIDEVQNIDSEIIEFNQRNPEVMITGSTKSRSLRQHRVTSEIAERLGGITVNRQRLNSVIRKRLQELGEEDFYQ